MCSSTPTNMALPQTIAAVLANPAREGSLIRNTLPFNVLRHSGDQRAVRLHARGAADRPADHRPASRRERACSRWRTPTSRRRTGIGASRRSLNAGANANQSPRRRVIKGGDAPREPMRELELAVHPTIDPRPSRRGRAPRFPLSRVAFVVSVIVHVAGRLCAEPARMVQPRCRRRASSPSSFRCSSRSYRRPRAEPEPVVVDEPRRESEPDAPPPDGAGAARGADSPAPRAADAAVDQPIVTFELNRRRRSSRRSSPESLAPRRRVEALDPLDLEVRDSAPPTRSSSGRRAPIRT